MSCHLPPLDAADLVMRIRLMRLSIKTLLSRQTSVRWNLSSNLASRVLAAVVNLACIPIYIRVLGVSGYGVIGIWLTLEALANLLDLGLSPAMTRELASTARSSEETQNLRDLVRTIEVIYWTVGLLIGAVIVLGAPLIATHWLQSSQLSADELRVYCAIDWAPDPLPLALNFLCERPQRAGTASRVILDRFRACSGP